MICSICKSPFFPEEPVRTCPGCQYEFHVECWEEIGGCGTPGCSNLPKESSAIDRPVNNDLFWGASVKNCPVCKEVIDLNTLECPFCHEVFDTAAPLSTSDIKEKYTVGKEQEIPENKWAVVVFIAGILGVTAPFNLLFGGMWYLKKRNMLKEVSPLYNILALTGLSFSAVFLVLFIIGIIFTKN